uniref:DED domain-containing protein n=1 Tax=Amphilophus citrinellus TaxID=61819 RepID=A0A3Q0QPT1_AMPCI
MCIHHSFQNSPDESSSVINNQTLMAISENLDSSEVAELCFLCCDIVSRKHLEEVVDAAGLFLRLSENGLLGNVTFLKQLLCIIHRKDLADLLQTDRRQPEEIDAGFPLSKYRLMLYKIYDDVTTDSLKRIKIQLRSKLSRRELDQCKVRTDTHTFPELYK